MSTICNDLSPWPQLSGMFRALERKDRNNILFKCLLCLLQEKILSCSKARSSNLRKHVKAQHGTQIPALERIMRKRAAEAAGDTMKQHKLSFSTTGVSQANIDDMVATFVIVTMQPFSVVEAPSFVNLVTNLAPNKTVITRRMLVNWIDTKYEAMRAQLVSSLESVPYVTVTADCWTSFRRAYLAATVSWLLPDCLSRKSAILTCRRMTGKISYDRIADVMCQTFDDFKLHGKITKVITDNGSNFVKAFRVLGPAEQGQDMRADEDDVPTDPIDVAALLDRVGQSDAGGRLPPHHRFSAHTLNLVATVDASKAESSEIFSRPLRSVMRTCRSLWNKQGQSATAAETIERYCGRALIRPVTTRWNSFFDAIHCLLELDNAGHDLDGLCRALQVPPFQRPRDFQFMKEYCEVMKPVAGALDILQRDYIFLGTCCQP
ncbi:uncharacterized protein LOC135373577 [Ornithodoros turicata]|uniref:uncharacterized protein LOC135373577 n=1 Tax=Ornithodoros turicata TaxID=34597 RepID=UPI00313A3AD0